MKMTFGLSTQFGYLCHLSPLLAWTTEIYTLSGGMFTDESVLELARGGGKDSEPRAQDEVLVLVLSLNLSGESGKSLHLLPLPHLGGTNTSKLNSPSQDCRYCLWKHGKCKVCSSIFKYKVNRHRLTTVDINCFHIKSLLYCSRVQISSKRRILVTTHRRRSNSTLSYQKERW